MAAASICVSDIAVSGLKVVVISMLVVVAAIAVEVEVVVVDVVKVAEVVVERAVVVAVVPVVVAGVVVVIERAGVVAVVPVLVVVEVAVVVDVVKVAGVVVGVVKYTTVFGTAHHGHGLDVYVPEFNIIVSIENMPPAIISLGVSTHVTKVLYKPIIYTYLDVIEGKFTSFVQPFNNIADISRFDVNAKMSICSIGKLLAFRVCNNAHELIFGSVDRFVSLIVKCKRLGAVMLKLRRTRFPSIDRVLIF